MRCPFARASLSSGRQPSRVRQPSGARGSDRARHPHQPETGQPVAANVLDRQFLAERPNQRWVGDTTEFLIGSSAKLYLAAIMDLHSRFIVGWAVSAVNDRHLTLSALDNR